MLAVDGVSANARGVALITLSNLTLDVAGVKLIVATFALIITLLLNCTLAAAGNNVRVATLQLIVIALDGSTINSSKYNLFS